jgi:hypothetical protein
MGGAVFLHVIHVMERDNCTSVSSHMGVVSLLPAADTAPFVMFQDIICEEKIRKCFDVKLSGIIFLHTPA